MTSPVDFSTGDIWRAASDKSPFHSGSEARHRRVWKGLWKVSFSHANLISGPNLELGPELQVTLMQQVKFRSRFCLHFFSLLIRMHNASLHEFVNKHLAIIWGHFRALLQAVFCREIELCCS